MSSGDRPCSGGQQPAGVPRAAASLTHTLSHALLQQNESIAHTLIAHAPQLAAIGGPVRANPGCESDRGT